MYLKDIFNIVDNLIPREFAIENDNIGYFGNNFDNFDIQNIKVVMDLLPKDDINFNRSDLVISHHPPLFIPKTPCYVVHSNWDVIGGGANDALVEYLGLTPISTFHKKTGIGRICSSNKTFDEFLQIVSYKFNQKNIRLVNNSKPEKILRKIAIVSGFGLSSKEFIKLAKDRSVDLFLSGDLSHSNAILANKLGITLVDIPHHLSELPGLYALVELLKNNKEINVPVELVDTGVPWQYIVNED